MAVESYILDHEKAPAALSMDELKKLLPRSLYLSGPFEAYDAWGNEYFYKFKGDLYQIRSAGKDGILVEYTVLGDDIVFQNGEFVDTQDRLEEMLKDWN